MSDMIDGALGELSPFEITLGFHVDGVNPSTATLPKGWEDRLIPVCNPNTNGATGWCLEVHDIAVSKYAAGREKDLAYIAVLWKEGLVKLETIEERLGKTNVESETREHLRSCARAHAAAHS